MKGQHFLGKPVEKGQSRVCLLFDPKDGRVVHGHGVTMLQSGKPIEPSELEDRARKHALSLGKPVEGLEALHLPVEAIPAHAHFKVNGEGNGIVALAPPPRRSGRRKSR